MKTGFEGKTKWFRRSLASLVLLAGFCLLAAGSGDGSSAKRSSSAGSAGDEAASSGSSGSKWSCSDYSVEEVVTYRQTYGSWPYGSGGLPEPSGSMASCFRRNWTFENCARMWGLGGDMYSCQSKVKGVCCN
jgi:hypothetical protein